MSNIIDIKNLSYSYGKHRIFDNLNLSIENGSFTTIIDSDNNGKSTLAKILSCHILTDADIKIFNKKVEKDNYINITKNISFVGENIDSVFIMDNVKENINFILANYGLNEEQVEKKISEFIAPLGLKKILKMNAEDLSMGEKQLIALFIGIAKGPKLLILDNSFSMIDKDKKTKIYLLLKKFNKQGLTIINFVSDNNEILNGTDIVILKNSKVLLNAPVKDAFNDISIYEKNNIPLPFVIDLSVKLKYYGKIDKIYFDYKKLVNDLWK